MNMLKTILVAEDETDIRDVIKKTLIDNNYSVIEAEDGIEAVKITDKKLPDLVILDLGLPKMSGESVCAEIKKNYPDMPVIILTARGQSSDVIRGFKIGADDYIAKPFVMDELLARIKARFNAKGEDRQKLQVGDLILDDRTKEVKRSSKLIRLTPKEYELLYYLMTNSGQVMSREMLLNKVWLYSPDIESRVVDVYVGYLRKKIDSPFKKKLIHSVRGFGYTIK